MLSDEHSVSSEQVGWPGKRRTWWHPLLVRLLSHLMGKAYEVQDEVLVGRVPLRVDMRWNLNPNLSLDLSPNLFLLPWEPRRRSGQIRLGERSGERFLRDSLATAGP